MYSFTADECVGASIPSVVVPNTVAQGTHPGQLGQGSSSPLTTLLGPGLDLSWV